MVSNCHYSLSSPFRTIRHYLQLFVSIWNYSICHFSLLFATIQLLFATSCHHSRLMTRIRSCILDIDDLSHTIRDYSYYSRLCAIRFFQTSIKTKPSFNTGEGTAQKLFIQRSVYSTSD